MSPEDFLKALSDIAEGARSNQRSSSVFFSRLREHFDADPSTLPIVTEGFKTADHPDLHLSVEAYLGAPQRSSTLMGFTSEQDRYVGVRINDLLVSGERCSRLKRTGMGRWTSTSESCRRSKRNQIILQSGLLERIERQTIRFSKHSQELQASGRHLRRGVLLYGPPGTGKTLSAMYLASQMPERTVLLVTGRSMGLIGEVCAMARALQPATVILEDVDLVAEQRTRQNTSCNAVLFELLNEMDGLAEDADILFLLTTNRPDILEPALAARPGRIDMAIEVPVPDDACSPWTMFFLRERVVSKKLAAAPPTPRLRYHAESFSFNRCEPLWDSFFVAQDRNPKHQLFAGWL